MVRHIGPITKRRNGYRVCVSLEMKRVRGTVVSCRLGDSCGRTVGCDSCRGAAHPFPLDDGLHSGDAKDLGSECPFVVLFEDGVEKALQTGTTHVSPPNHGTHRTHVPESHRCCVWGCVAQRSARKQLLDRSMSRTPPFAQTKNQKAEEH